MSIPSIDNPLPLYVTLPETLDIGPQQPGYVARAYDWRDRMVVGYMHRDNENYIPYPGGEDRIIKYVVMACGAIMGVRDTANGRRYPGMVNNVPQTFYDHFGLNTEDWIELSIHWLPTDAADARRMLEEGSWVNSLVRRNAYLQSPLSHLIYSLSRLGADQKPEDMNRMLAALDVWLQQPMHRDLRNAFRRFSRNSPLRWETF